MEQQFLQSLEEKIKGVWFISESEFPFTIENFNVHTGSDIPAIIASNTGITVQNIKKVDAETFFRKVEKSSDPGDGPVVANMNKIKALYVFLNQQLKDLQVYRLEGGVQVPIYISGYLPYGELICLKTISVES